MRARGWLRESVFAGHAGLEWWCGVGEQAKGLSEKGGTARIWSERRYAKRKC
jgi:hypothetical protein